MSATEEMVPGESLALTRVPVGQVVSNDYNPNEMTPAQFEILKRSLRERGYVMPIIVRQIEPEKYIITDGEHRWRAFREVFPNAQFIDVSLTEETDREAKVTTLAMNKIRGEENWIKLAAVVNDLTKKDGMTLEEIEQSTGYKASKLESVMGTLEVPQADPDFVFKPPTQDAVGKKVVEQKIVAFNFWPDDDAVVQQAIRIAARQLEGDFEESEAKGRALASICRKYLDEQAALAAAAKNS